MPLERRAIRATGATEDLRVQRVQALRQQAGDSRSSGRHDRDRIYYARSLLRLSGVTQVLTPDEAGAFTHNRLTHSLKVAQVARSIAELKLNEPDGLATIEVLGGLDADVVEAAALGHDLGHPPFGHIGEVVLDRFAREQLGLTEGFEGNAQSFRILANLEPRSNSLTGIDPSAATLAALLKYPWWRGTADDAGAGKLPKFGYYKSEEEAYRRARAWLPSGYAQDAQTLEAAIMDIADDITYALHDFEDFRSAGLISVREVIADLRQWSSQHAARLRSGDEPRDETSRWGRLRTNLGKQNQYDSQLYADAVDAVTQHLTGLDGPTNGYWRVGQATSRRFISSQITAYIGNLEFNTKPGRHAAPIALSAQDWHQIQILKQVTREYVISRADVAAVQRGQQRRLWKLLSLLHAWLKDDEDLPRAAVELQELWSQHGSRGLLDYVSGLTDLRARALHSMLTGEDVQTVTTALQI